MTSSSSESTLAAESPHARSYLSWRSAFLVTRSDYWSKPLLVQADVNSSDRKYFLQSCLLGCASVLSQLSTFFSQMFIPNASLHFRLTLAVYLRWVLGISFLIFCYHFYQLLLKIFSYSRLYFPHFYLVSISEWILKFY